MRFSGRPRDVKSPGTQPAKAIPVAGWLERLLGLLRLRVRYRISGSSMLPLLREEDEVFVDPRAVVRLGDIVIARHPYRLDSIWVKRISSFDDAGRAMLEGVNSAESTDSRTQGMVPRNLILGKVTSRIRSS